MTRKKFLLLLTLCLSLYSSLLIFQSANRREVASMATLNLGAPVHLKGEPYSLLKYTTQMQAEQSGALNYLLTSPTWHENLGIQKKVSESGKFLPFYGDTMVFPYLENDFKSYVKGVQSKLYGHFHSILAEPIDLLTLHMTLHDLSSGQDYKTQEIEAEKNRLKVARIMGMLRQYLEIHPDDRFIKLHSTNLYPSVNTSIVMGLLPVTERDFKILMNLSELFDDVVTLSYFLRPHITIAYFRPGMISPEEMRGLHRVLLSMNESREIELDLYELTYQFFRSMNDYEDHLKLSGDQKLD